MFDTLIFGILALAIGAIFFALWHLQRKLQDLTKPEDAEKQKIFLQMLENLRKEIRLSSGEQRQEMLKTLTLLENKFTNFNQSVDAKIAENTKILGERLDNAARVIGAVRGELGKMQEIRGAVDSLTNFLRHNKRRGDLGEEGLKEMLNEALPREKFELQFPFRSGEKVDAIIKTKNGLIPVDAKFPLENFEKLTHATEPKIQTSFRLAFQKDVKKHLDAIAQKYLRPDEGTTDFAVMYLPAESLFNEASENVEICKYARAKKIQMVSPSSFFYFLRVILMAYQSERFAENAKQVLHLIAGVKVEATKFGEGLNLTAKHLNHANTKMQESLTSYQKLEMKIERVQELKVSQSPEPKSLTA